MLEISSRRSVGGLRVLGARDLPAVQQVLDADPWVNVFVAEHVAEAGPQLRGLNGQLWGYFEPGGRLTSVCYAGANLVPVGATPEAVHAFAARARKRGRGCSSMWGRREAVEPLWRALAASWGPARLIRESQPFLALNRPPAVAPDPAVRRVGPEDLDAVYRASVAFFTEELEISPEGRGGDYRGRVERTVNRGRCFARIEQGEVVFKADIGVVSPAAFQIQGVWVHPDLRGQGLSAPGVAAVVAAGMQDLAPVATLYVNDFNIAARRSYARVGFTPAATFMTVLF